MKRRPCLHSPRKDVGSRQWFQVFAPAADLDELHIFDYFVAGPRPIRR